MKLETLYHVMREISEVKNKLLSIGSFTQLVNSTDIYISEVHKLAWLCEQLEPLCEGVDPVNLRFEKGEFIWDEHLDIFENQEEKENDT